MNELISSLKELRDESSKKAKTEIIQKYQTNPLFMDVLYFLYNPFIVTGLSTKKMSRDVTPNRQITDLKELLDYLIDNNTGSDEVLSVVQGYLSTHDDEAKEILSQLVSKTLVLGVSAKSINTAIKDNLIPVFEVQLAFLYDKAITATSSTRQIDRYGDDDLFYVTQKLDGFRGIITYENDKVTVFSRKGQRIEGLDDLCSSVKEFVQINDLDAKNPHGLVFDGELLLDKDLPSDVLFRETSKVLRKDGEKKNIRYHLFDIVPLQEFYYSDMSTNTYTERRQVLDTLQSTQWVEVVPVLAIITKDKIAEWSNHATEHGWEGVMLNYADGYYRTKRSTELLKVKKMHTADLEIVGFNQAIDGKFAGMLQSINVKLDDDNIVQVGSGLTEELRKEIWENQDKYIGCIVEIQYFEQSQDRFGNKSLRFPVFKDFRFDKSTEDVNVE